MHGERVDGDDLDAVVEAGTRLLHGAREERRPAVLEAVTYLPRPVADAGLAYRTREEIEERQSKDAIVRVRERLRDAGVLEAELDAVDNRTDERVRAAVEFADASPEPDVGRLAAAMYAPGGAGSSSACARSGPFGEEALVFEGLGS